MFLLIKSKNDQHNIFLIIIQSIFLNFGREHK